MTDGMRFETKAIHSGQDPDPATGAVVVPIYQTSTYVQDAVGQHKGYEYSRTDNPTRHALETCLADLDGATAAIAFSSGMAALATLALTLKPGQKVIIPDDVYGGTYRLFAKVFSELGISWSTASMQGDLDPEAFAEAGLVVVETPTNPTLRIIDIAAVAEMAHEAGAIVAVDNTFATPFIQRPLELGADVAVYSATKYLGGHSDLVAGSMAVNDPDLVQRLRFLQNAVGAIPGPFDCWLLLRGLKTLGIRMKAHCEGAERVVTWLTEHPRVTKVHWPGLPTHPSHDVATRQMAASGAPLYGGMVAFHAGSEQEALAVCEKTQLFFLGESLGGVESLIEHPGKMTHASLAGSGIEVAADLVRLSVGIEHPDDLIDDLSNALG